MKLNLYSIYDEAARAYTTPFFMQNNALATRAFQDQVSSETSQIGKHPEQFILFQIAEFDDNTGEIIPLDKHQSLGRAVQYKQDTQKEETIKIMDMLEEILSNQARG